MGTPNLPTNIVDFRGFDSSTILNLRADITRSIGDLPEILSQAMLVGTKLVGGLGVPRLMGYLVLQGNLPFGAARFEQLLELPARKRPGTH